MRVLVLFFGFMTLCLGSKLFGQGITDTIEIRKMALGKSYYLGEERLTLRRLAEITSSDALAHKKIKLAQTCNVFGCVFGAAGGACIGYPVGTLIGGGQPNWIVAGVGAGFLLIGVSVAIAGDIHIAKGVAMYNRGLQQANADTVYFRLNFTPTGIGVVMKF
jgi:hypothetical protein